MLFGDVFLRVSDDDGDGDDAMSPSQTSKALFRTNLRRCLCNGNPVPFHHDSRWYILLLRTHVLSNFPSLSNDIHKVMALINSNIGYEKDSKGLEPVFKTLQSQSLYDCIQQITFGRKVTKLADKVYMLDLQTVLQYLSDNDEFYDIAANPFPFDFSELLANKSYTPKYSLSIQLSTRFLHHEVSNGMKTSQIFHIQLMLSLCSCIHLRRHAAFIFSLFKPANAESRVLLRRTLKSRYVQPEHLIFNLVQCYVGSDYYWCFRIYRCISHLRVQIGIAMNRQDSWVTKLTLVLYVLSLLNVFY